MAKTDTSTTSSTATTGTTSSNASSNAGGNKAADAYRSAREKTGSALSGAREKTSDYTQKVGTQITTNPVGALVGGFAVGALVGALLPRSEREQQYLGSAGRKLTEAARSAASTAVENSRDKIDQATGSVVNKLGAAVLETVNHTGT